MNDGKNIEIREITQVCVKPTDRFPGLSEAGGQLLEAIIDPVNRILPITKLCERAGISRDSYYRLWKQPEFQTAYRELCQTTCLSQALAAMQALCQQAARGDTGAIKMVLEMAGIYQPQATANINHTIDAGPTLRDLLTRYRARNQQQELKGN
jgi:hypothetical protein